MLTEPLLPVSREGVMSWSQRAGEPAWLTELRLQALERSGTLDWPHLEKMKLSRWKLGSFGEHRTAAPIKDRLDLPAVVRQYLHDDRQDNLLVQRNSGVVYANLAPSLAEQGVIFTDLQTAVREHEALVRPYLFSLVQPGEHKVSALHAAWWSGGVFLYVPRNVVIEQPIQAVFLSDEDEAAFSPHILIVAEPNSRVSYVDNVIGGESGRRSVHNGIAEVFVKDGAQVDFASIHCMGREITDLTIRRAHVERDARIQWIIGQLNDGDSMSDTMSILQGRGSNSETKLICVGTGSQAINASTRAQHIGRGSASDMLTRAVMRDEATGIFNGITKIEKGATDSNGQQTERVLMLSPRARGDANPLLLIDEDEVKAGHAASVGQVNKDQIYYLMSRGIPREDAVKLIVYGFLSPIVAEIPIESVEKQLAALVERKLGHA